MELHVSKQVDKEEWEELIHRFGGSIYHSAKFADIQRERNIPRYFKYLHKNECIGVASGICCKARFPFFLCRALEFETLPCVINDDPEIMKAMILEIIAYSKRKRYRSTYFNSYDSPIPLDNFNGMGFDITPRIEFVFDLKKTEEEIWNDISGKRKWDIKRGEKNDIEFVRTSDKSYVEKLVSLMDKSLSRHGVSGEFAPVIEKIEKLLDAKLAEIFFAKYNDEVVSVALVTLYNGRGYANYAGNNRIGMEHSASSFLFWKTALELKKLGFLSYNIGGVSKEAENKESIQHGLYRFKSSFGTEKRYCYSINVDNCNIIGYISKVVHNIKDKYEK